MNAQLDFRYSQYMYNLITINPGTVGLDDQYRFSGFHKSQWVNKNTVFHSESITISSPIFKNGLAFGALFKRDDNTPYVNTLFNVFSSYKINAFNGLLSFGLAAGLWESKWDESSFKKKDDNDPLTSSTQQILKPDLSLGIFFQNNKSQFGISIAHLIVSKNTNLSQELTYQYICHYTRKVNLTENLQFIPSFLYRGVQGFRDQLEVSNHIMVKRAYWFGLSIRTSLEYSAHVGFHLNNLSEKITDEISIGYAFDHSFDPYSPARAGSHEIMIRVGIKPLPKPNQIRKHRINISPIFF